MRFTLARQQFELTADDVRDRLVGCQPDSIHQYWLDVDGVRWPVKQVMAVATGLSKGDFQSQNCRRLLAKLGFTIGKGGSPLSVPAPERQAERCRRQLPPWESQTADVVLVGCVKSKRSQGALAKDLYTSDYFAKMRAYAERMGRPWFILSAEHGLVSPDEWLEPYDCYLPDMSVEYRRSWGQRVAAQLSQTIGSLGGLVIDIHAGSTYVDSAEPALVALGAVVIDDRKGLSFGRRLSWYLQREQTTEVSVGAVAEQLKDSLRAWSLPAFLATNGDGLRSAGMYSWWVDEMGADDLSRGLGHHIPAGLVYAGLAGATRSGGAASSNTLWGRIATMHLGTRHEFSTLRRTLGSILAETHGLVAIDEAELSRWMHAHLKVVAIPVADGDTLDQLETELLVALDPPLNLAKVAKTPLRARISALRKQYSSTDRIAEAPARE